MEYEVADIPVQKVGLKTRFDPDAKTFTADITLTCPVEPDTVADLLRIQKLGGPLTMTIVAGQQQLPLEDAQQAGLPTTGQQLGPPELGGDPDELRDFAGSSREPAPQ